MIILGDLNISYIYSKTVPHPLLKPYKQFLSSFGLKQIISSPTRITCETSTLIDHVLVNSTEKISQFGIIESGLSDHQMVYCTRKINRIKKGGQKYINFRSLKSYSAEAFVDALKDLDFPNYNDF